MSWSYPDRNSLRDLIERANLHPITMLTSLPQSSKMTLLEHHVVLCTDIHQNASVLDLLRLTKEERSRVLAEVAFISRSEQ
jgi:hypothetical protein